MGGGGVCTLSRSSHLYDISWETRGVSSGKKYFKQGKKGLAEKISLSAIVFTFARVSLCYFDSTTALKGKKGNNQWPSHAEVTLKQRRRIIESMLSKLTLTT